MNLMHIRYDNLIDNINMVTSLNMHWLFKGYHLVRPETISLHQPLNVLGIHFLVLHEVISPNLTLKIGG